MLLSSLIPSVQGIVDRHKTKNANMIVSNFTRQIYNLFNATQLQSLVITICTNSFDYHIGLIHFKISR